MEMLREEQALTEHTLLELSKILIPVYKYYIQLRLFRFNLVTYTFCTFLYSTASPVCLLYILNYFSFCLRTFIHNSIRFVCLFVF